jgi:hypothetical protein
MLWHAALWHTPLQQYGIKNGVLLGTEKAKKSPHPKNPKENKVSS